MGRRNIGPVGRSWGISDALGLDRRRVSFDVPVKIRNIGG